MRWTPGRTVCPTTPPHYRGATLPPEVAAICRGDTRTPGKGRPEEAEDQSCLPALAGKHTEPEKWPTPVSAHTSGPFPYTADQSPLRNMPLINLHFNRGRNVLFLEFMFPALETDC